MSMSAESWVSDENAALFTDLYQLTMLQAYFREGMTEDAVFDLFVRRLGDRNYLLACGLDTVLHYLETFHFREEGLSYIESLGRFDQPFLEYLRTFRFRGTVFAVREGTPVYPNEPILEVIASIGEAQIIETFLLNQITFQTNAATKASRVKQAAGSRIVADFGMRRMHGADAALRGARAFHIAGLDSTSNVLAGRLLGIPVTGTMAHSYIEAHDREESAFRAFASIYPETILLVDTYDTLQGVRKVVELARGSGDAFDVSGIRLDSGDLVQLAIQSRRILDEAGLDEVSIFASGSLDEYAIEALLESGAPIDGFGVGTKMGTIADQPYLDTVYKISGYAGKPRMKLSSQKSNLPGRKQVFRQYRGSEAIGDVITVHDEAVDGEPLLEQVMADGRRTDAGRRSLEDAREHARLSLDSLPPQSRAIRKVEPEYPVRISAALRHRLDKTRSRLEDEIGAFDQPGRAAR